MTIKLMALYTRPDDVEAFMTYYNDVHLPLVDKLPGLQKTIINRVTGSPMGGDPAYFLIAEMHFADKEAFDEAMRSPENRAVGKDVMSFAKGLVTVLVAEAP